MTKRSLFLFFEIFVLNKLFVSGHPRNLVWTGGPVHFECDHTVEMLTGSGCYQRENVIAIKAVAFRDDIYILTPRLKKGVLASVWLIVNGRQGVELQPFPDLRSHTLGNCENIQSSIDFHLDHIGNLWILDSGIIDSVEQPKCMCPPKVVALSFPLKKITRTIELSTLVQPTSVLQNIVVEYEIGKTYIYVSDASRGAILVHDLASGAGWAVLACAPATGLQIALVKRGLVNSVLLLFRLHHQGILELDTNSLKRHGSLAPLKVFNEHSKPVVLLGSGAHYIYVRHAKCTEVLRWDTREPYNDSALTHIHSPGPHMTPTAVATEPFKNMLSVLDSNYAETLHSNRSTYHRITFIG